MADNRFDQEYQKLNPEQRRAVDAIEGPVMVVAGPGTGKTQVVAMRIANILLKTHLGAKNILALTFTEAGVTALRDRLTKYAGPLAYQVTIATFHGFANEIIGTFPHIFAQTRQLTQIDELERLLLLEKILKKITNVKLLRPLRKESAHIRDIAQAIRQCKQEAITASQIEKFANSVGKKITKTTKKLEREKFQRQSEILTEFSKVLTEYFEALSDQSRYDYEDMILFVIEALRENAEVKAYFQERYQYILVDEYQDTNNAQNTLVELLADFFETPNLFVVGDDKQAIYRFQGASVVNMLHFHSRYPDLTIISLQINYRSTTQILVSASTLIEQNLNQLSNSLPEISTKLIASNGIGEKPELWASATPLAEQYYIAKRIKEFSKQGVPWNDIAILLRTNAEANTYRDVLEKVGIPVAGLQSTNLLHEKEIQVLLQMLQAVISPKNDTAVVLYLKLMSSKEGILELIELVRSSRDQKTNVLTLALKAKKSIATHAQQLLAWHQEYEKWALPELLEKLLYNSGVLESVRSRPNSVANLELLAALVTNAREFTLKNQNATLRDWLDYIELHKTYGVQFSVNRSRAELEGISVTTVHQAKGLEYEAVILPNVTDKTWRVKPDRSVVRIPPELLHIKSSENEIEDLRRLFYVALTRAKKHLCLSYSVTDVDGKTQLPSQLVVEIESTLSPTSIKLETKELENFISSQISPIPNEYLDAAELRFIREKVRSIPMSFTAYWDYKECPRTYLLKHIYSFPTPFEPSLSYGDSVHKALEQFAREHKAFKKLPSKEKLLTFYNEALQKSLPFSDRDQFLNQGLDVLSSYYDNVIVSDQMPLEVEYNFRMHHVTLGEIGLTGKIDRIEPVDLSAKKVRVIDYKTGSTAKSRNFIEGKTKDSDGKMKVQLIFYAMLCQIDPLFPYSAVEFDLRFIDDKKTFSSETFIISPEEIKELRSDVERVYQEILTTKNFPVGNPESEIALLFPSLT